MIKGVLSNQSPFAKVLILFIVIFLSTFIVSLTLIVAALPVTGLDAIKNFVTGEAVSMAFLKYLQAVNGIALFIVPSLIVAWLFSERPMIWLGFRPAIPSLLLFTILIFLVCQPLVTQLAQFNAGLSLPDFIKPLEEWMQNEETLRSDLIFKMLDTHNSWAILGNLLIVVLIPAVGEEMLFRGTLQPLLGQWIRSNHAAVWITAFLFSAMHIQFLTFLPRFLLGILLGYLLVYGKNIWYPIAGHFANNFLSLVIFYYYRITKPDFNPMDAEATGFPFWMVTLSFVMVTALFYLFIKQYRQMELTGQQDPEERVSEV